MDSPKDKKPLGEEVLSSIQINLRLCENAFENWFNFVHTNKIDSCLIQKPWVRGNVVMGLNNNEFTLLYQREYTRPRSSILVRKPSMLSSYQLWHQGSHIVVKTENLKQACTFASCYCAHENEGPPIELRNLVIA